MNDVTGMEFDWLGTDRWGYIGIFSSAGFGPVPQAALNCLSSAVVGRSEITGLADRLGLWLLSAACLRLIGSTGKVHTWCSLFQAFQYVVMW